MSEREVPEGLDPGWKRNFSTARSLRTKRFGSWFAGLNPNQQAYITDEIIEDQVRRFAKQRSQPTSIGQLRARRELGIYMDLVNTTPADELDPIFGEIATERARGEEAEGKLLEFKSKNAQPPENGS